MTLILKMSQAKDLLENLGFASAQTNERSCRTLLALLDLKIDGSWKDSTNRGIGVTPIMDWIDTHLGFHYAPNSRETIRRQTLHQFIDSGLVTINEDDSARSTNSSKTNYKITNEALLLIQGYDESDFSSILAAYLSASPGLKAKYAAARMMARVPVQLPSRYEVTLSAGGQNILIKQIIEDFCERFAPGGEVIYIGDTGSKIDPGALGRFLELGAEINPHGKLPDVVVYLESENWLFLIEAASSHGPVDAKRFGELSELFAGVDAGLVFVSCFPNREIMRQFLSDLAWETEVWIASEPSHMIHLNGSRFMGPYADLPGA